jgi:hypothetical protein
VTRLSTFAVALALASAVGCAAPGAERTARGASALVIQAQGSFAVGGTVLSTPGIYNNNLPTAEGQTFHGDHLWPLSESLGVRAVRVGGRDDEFFRTAACRRRRSRHSVVHQGRRHASEI